MDDLLPITMDRSNPALRANAKDGSAVQIYHLPFVSRCGSIFRRTGLFPPRNAPEHPCRSLSEKFRESKEYIDDRRELLVATGEIMVYNGRLFSTRKNLRLFSFSLSSPVFQFTLDLF